METKEAGLFRLVVESEGVIVWDSKCATANSTLKY